MPENISIRIDGEYVPATEGQTILEVARAGGKYIPTLCWLDGTVVAWAPAASASWRSPAWAACCPPAPLRCRTA